MTITCIFIFAFLKDNGKEHIINKLQNEIELLTKERDEIKASVLETAQVSEQQVIKSGCLYSLCLL